MHPFPDCLPLARSLTQMLALWKIGNNSPPGSGADRPARGPIMPAGSSQNLRNPNSSPCPTRRNARVAGTATSGGAPVGLRPPFAPTDARGPSEGLVEPEEPGYVPIPRDRSRFRHPLRRQIGPALRFRVEVGLCRSSLGFDRHRNVERYDL